MGKQINQSIVIDAKIKATLEGMNDVVSKLNKGLREGTTKIDLTKGVGNSISKQIETFKTEYSKFIQLTKTGKIEFGDTKDAIRSGEQMVKTFSELKRIVGNFEDMSLLDAKKTFPDAFDSKVDSLSKKLNALRENIVSLDSKKIELNDARQALKDLTVKQQDLQKELSEQLEVKIDTETAEQNLEETKKKIFELREELKKELSGKLAGTDSIKNSLEARKAEILKARKTRGVTSEPLSGAQVKAAGGSKEQQAAASQALKLYNSEKAELKEIEEALRKNAAAAKEYRKALTSADSAKLTDLADKAESSETKINEITDALKKQEQAQIDLNEASERREQQEKKTSSIKKDLDETTRSLELQEQKVNKLQTAYDQLIAKTNPEELIKAFKELGIDFTPEMAKNEQSVRQLQKQLNSLDKQDHKKLIQSLQQMGLSADNAKDYVRQLKGQLTTIDDSAKDISRAAQEMENLKNQVLQFFSVTNAIQLFKRTVQSAINTVKELDAVMTETAVVTDFSVGDMWEKLPEYASHANALGASIKDVYAATTLYYQQGLQTNEAMGVGVETMKMARIANLEAGDATQYMTAALRGFNMEVNELNAERVNDVYSELAAITAADTSQIATAMSKTASIASAANMEFETTAALLAQIIETTQEAPETAGTALKTIIARFSEVKKLREEGANTGEDEEGEAIDVNKIQGALRTVGISMDDFFAGAEGLDSILLKLAGKWNTLDFETQRYIATTAAGSRQQSRFIAMMSDYERTMELATAANNSAGASQQQFDKTLESMEAKLQKLKNAWNEFTMGLANNEILKFGVDVLTGLLNTVNKLTSSLSGGNGLVKSVVNLATAIGALKGGAMIMGKLFGETQINVTGKKGNIFSLGKTNAVQQIMGNNTQQQGYIEGQKAGQGFASGFKEKLQSLSTSAGYKTHSSGFFGSVIDIETKGQISNSKEYARNKNRIDELNKIMTSNSPDAARNFDAYEKELEDLERRQQQLSGGTTALQVNFTNLGMAMTGVGTAATLLGGLFEKMGMEEFGKIVKNVGSVLTGLGTTMMLLGPLLNKIGLSIGKAGISFAKAGVAGVASGTATTIAWGPLLATLLPIVAVLGLVVAAFIGIRNASPEVQLKKAKEAADQAGEAANAAAEAYNNLKASFESIEGKEDILKDLAVGTLEWKEAVSELNNEILDLVSKYPELSQFVSSTDGILSISDEGAAKILENQYKVQESTQAAKTAAQIRVQKAQQTADFADLDYRLKLTEIIETPDGPVEVIDRAATDELAKKLASGKISTDDASLDFLKNVEGGYDEFLEYGRALLASEQAIEVFTDSLLNAATVNAEIPQDLKDKVAGAFDTQSIDKLISTEGVNLGTINKADKEAYAEAMGYTHISGNKYKDASGNEIKVSKNEVREQLAAIKAQDSLTNKITQLGKVIGQLNKSTNSLDKAFVSMTSKADGAGLTLEDISSLKGKFDGAYQDNVESDINGNFTSFKDAELQTLYSQVKDIYSPEEFYRIFSDAYSQASERASQAQYKLSSMGLKGQFDSAKIDTGALFEISNSLYDVFLRSGSEATQQLGQKLSEITSSLSPENAQIFANALNSLDWNNIDSIKELDTILSGMGFTGQIKDVEALEQQIISAAKAGRDFSLEKVKEELKSLANLKTDLKERIEDENYTFTEEEKDEYLKEMPELKEQFIQTDADEWIYIGGHLEDLQGALNENTKAVLAKTEEDAKGKAQESQKWIDLMDSTKQYEYTSKRFNDTGTAEYTVSESGTFSEVVSGILDGTILDTEVMVSVLESLNADTSGNITDLVNRIEMLFTENYGTNGTVAASNISNYEDAQKATSSVALSYKNPYELAGMVQNTTTQYNGSALETQAVDNSAYLDALNAQAIQAGVTTAEIERLTKAQEEQGKSGDEAKAAALAQAISMKKQQTAINEASETLGKYLETMDDAEKGSVTYNEALSKIPKQIEKAFGFEPSMEWVQDNLDLIKDWAAGSEEAGAQIWENLTNGFSSAMAACEANVGQSVTNMVDWLNWFSGMNVWASAYLDNSGFMNAIATSETEAKEFADWLETQGYETELVEIAPKPMTLKRYNGSVLEDTVVMQPQYQVKWKNTGNPWTGGGGGGYDAPSSYTPKSGGGGGGGGGGSEPTKWENPYDEFYNTVEKLNEELRTREKLERRYQKLLDNTNTKASDLVKNSREQLASLEEERKTREYLLKGRERQMADVEREYGDLGSYAWYNEEKQVIEINWTKIEALDGSTNEDLTSRIEEYIGKLEEQQDLIEEEQDSIAEIEDAVKEIREQGKDEYFDLESQIKEALEKARQEEIDKLSQINDSINDTNSRLIDAMQSSIDKYRQDRENERTEEELSDKQRRLAYLQQDTSGANALEILQLQEEIAQGQEDYTDTLIDQKISELQEQNDEAAEQRQQQIDLMQAQLDHYLDSELVWADIYSLMNSGIGPDGIIAGSALEQLLMESASFEAMSYLEKMKWLEELENNVSKAVQWLMEGNSTEALMAIGDLSKGQKIEFTTADGEKVSGTLDEAGNVITDSGEKYEGVYRTYNGAFITQENYIKPEPPKPVEPEPEQPAFTPPQLTDNIKRGVSAAIWNGNYGWGVGGTRTNRLAEVFGANDIQRNYVDRYVTSGYSGSLSDYSYINMRKKFKQYKTGGLADFTGPAWLDGTKSKPEYILNAEQTKSFFQLVDVLGSLKSGVTQSSQITGDSIYDVDINVESIGNDYDVEQLASTIKRMINDDARYRNNNAINLQR